MSKKSKKEKKQQKSSQVKMSKVYYDCLDAVVRAAENLVFGDGKLSKSVAKLEKAFKKLGNTSKQVEAVKEEAEVQAPPLTH